MHSCLTKLIKNFAQLSIKNVPKARYCTSIKVVYKPLQRGIDGEPIEESKTGKLAAIENLSKIFGVTRYTALNWVLKYENLIRAPGSLIHNNYNLCLTNGLNKETCMKYSGILAEWDLEKKFYLLKKLDCDINLTTPLLILDYDRLITSIGTQFARNKFLKRVDTFKNLFQMDVEVTCEVFVKRFFLKDISLAKIEENATLLLRNGVTSEEIMNDWWVLKYNSSTILDRIELAVDNNVDFKTWMVRAKPEIFEKYIKRRSDNMLILGNSTVAEYLAEKLECSVQEAKYIINRLPALNSKSLKKLEELINFLYLEGFKPSHVCRLPKVLMHSVTTMRQRVRELRKQKVRIDSLHPLIKTKKQYLQYYTALVKANKNKIKEIDS